MAPVALTLALAACAQVATAQGVSRTSSLQRPDTYTNSIGVEFARIAAGSFMMGSTEVNREVPASEKPRHPVTISKSFYLARFELTQAQWEAVMGSNPYTLSRSNPYYNLPGMAARITKPTHPATVSWNDAQEFIRRLNEKEGVALYRLPTEAEWEYAARAGTTTAYSFGEDAGQLDRYAWHGESFATGGTHPVGQKPANPWGLHDVHGNVWEWVQDRYDPDYYASSPSSDPQGPLFGSQRVVRGGSWHSTGDGWRSAFRRAYEPDYRGISIGLRLVREIP
ncbi:formylglycine-generating enzyme family protein [Variovorax saccharolyticus]|uniref:formylglycine-generating enzyme family protein n=1 Tax=Variovorax saccharolyticus TaxID=3053516 RepID=UPI0025766D7B|nr:formylglycine-generating enzyme family protein [Variovorax sp. J22R187]MDM0021840.1 formylglycine-generating enzyme family protein [Variovorax sp. J22R187]